MRLSNQAMGAIMMALQKSLLNQEDIVPMLEGFVFRIDMSNETLIVVNPPSFEISEADSEDDQEDYDSIISSGSD